MKVYLAVPSYAGLVDAKGEARCVPFCRSLADTIALFLRSEIGLEAQVLPGDCYIQNARNRLTRSFMASDADVMLFLDDDVEWRAEDAKRLVETDGDVVAGIYRKKVDAVEYPVAIYTDDRSRPVVRGDGCIAAMCVPTGFLKITRNAIARLQAKHPELLFMYEEKEHYDLFPQGVHEGKWWGEDFAFCRLWRDLGERAWVIPDITLTHWKDKPFTGNYHEYLMRLPGGAKDGAQ